MRQNKGFTLLEILLVIAAIGILAAIVLVAINPNRQIEAARNAKRKSDINTIIKAIQQYSIDNNGQNPTGIETGAKAICNTGSQKSTDTLNPANLCDNKVNLKLLVPDYLASIPEPDSNNYYVRRSNNSIEVSHPRDNIWNIGGTPSLDLNFASNKSLIDNVTGNNLITFTRNSIGTHVGADGLIKTAGVNEPRFDHNPVTGESLGLLLEEQRTNSIRNNTMLGAVAGTPGTNPTGWIYATTSSNGLTISIAGTGVDNGINYIDYRFNGTTVASPNGCAIGFANAAAVTGQTWTASMYWKLAAGSTTGTTNWQLGIIESTAGGSFVTGAFSSQTEPTSAALITQRPAATRTLSGGATVGLVSYPLNIPVAGNTAIDFTLRIGLPQLEQGGFATSVIPTSITAVTRNADVASITGSNFSSWFTNANENTFYLEAIKTQHNSLNGSFFSGGNGLNAIGGGNISFIGDGTRLRVQSRHGAVRGDTGSSAPIAIAGSLMKGVLSTSTTTFGAAVNGQLLTGGAPAQNDWGTALTLGWFPNGGYLNPLNGHIRRLTYWPTRLPNSTLQALTQ